MQTLTRGVGLAVTILSLGGCGGASTNSLVSTADSGVVAVAPTPTPTPSPTPTPTPTATTASSYVASSSLAGGAPLHAAFDIQKGLKLSWGTGAIPGLYASDGSEGAFRFTCGGEGKVAYDDPIVFPGQPGKSHLHQPWGNADFNANTTPETLAQSAETDCNYTPYSLNRSGYWMPALINDQGQVIHPDLVSVYYKRKTSSSAFCDPKSASFIGTCIGLPNRIRFVFGWNMFEPTAPVQGASWYCTTGDKKHYSNLDDVFNSGCVAGAQLIANTLAPNCWDGANLDSPDHRSHMAYGSYGQTGKYHCPKTHPYYIPQEENKVTFTVTADMIGTNPDGTHYSRIKLSSDHMLPNAKPGQTLHSDYMEAWVTEAKDMWMKNCIEKGLNCSGGDLGNGMQLIGASQPSYGWTNPNPREPIPPRPS